MNEVCVEIEYEYIEPLSPILLGFRKRHAVWHCPNKTEHLFLQINYLNGWFGLIKIAAHERVFLVLQTSHDFFYADELLGELRLLTSLTKYSALYVILDN
jgi:hypothetical protein